MNKGLKMLAVTGSRESQDDRRDMRNDYDGQMRMGGYDMESNNPEMRRYSRDRRGRFTGEMDGGYRESNANRWYPPYYDVEINRYEYENEQPEGNYGESNYRTDMRDGRNRGREGGGRRSSETERRDKQNGGGNMRMIGFGRELYDDMRSDATMPKHREMDHMAGIRALPGGAKSNMGMDEHMAKEWTAMMMNEDGTKGPHWSMEQIKKVIEQRNMPGDPVEIWVAMNMMYSDYCKVAKKLGVNTMDFYAEMARAFLDDKDAGVPDKLTAYYKSIVKG